MITTNMEQIKKMISNEKEFRKENLKEAKELIDYLSDSIDYLDEVDIDEISTRLKILIIMMGASNFKISGLKQILEEMGSR
mgnify:CR=1 FL=1